MNTPRNASPAARRRRRRGVTLPLIAASFVGLCGFVALAVDVGRISVARGQAQAAADVAAMAGARSLNGILPQDVATATSNAKNAAAAITVLGQAISTSNVSVTHGTYRYDTVNQVFTPQYSLNAGELYNLTQAKVTLQMPTTFARAVGINTFSVSATGTAAHRPRDVVIVLDYSASMHTESFLWNTQTYLDNGSSPPNNPNNTSNNAETVYPLFGHYSGTSTATTPTPNNYSDYTRYPNLLSPTAGASNPLTGNPAIGKSNVSVPALGVPAMVNDFWQNARGASAASAFTPVPDSTLDSYKQPYSATDPAVGGDRYLRKNSNDPTKPYAVTLADVIGSTANSTFETKGYAMFGTASASKGFIQGPRYWGKTFFIWPPDPRNDWRQLYFGTGSAVTSSSSPFDNTNLWDSSGNWLDPQDGGYKINYAKILNWIKNVGPNPFPPTLRSGNVLYYSQIPSDVPSSAYNPSQANSAITNADQRFWKEYIDYVVGSWRDPYGYVRSAPDSAVGYGPDFTFGTVRISSPPGGGKYMNYLDNPKRPRHRLWFGPMTMIQYMMSAGGILPGTAHDISMYPMKTGIGAALQNIQNNHPNDLVSMILFSRPQYGNDPANNGSFSLAQYSLTTDYQSIINSLWIPPNSSGSSDVRPWDANGMQIPRARGNFDQNTASSYGLMLAYNQFSSNSSLRALETGSTPGVGGLGRVGAQRLVIYETDGVANLDTLPSGGFTNLGANNSYYPILPGQTVKNGTYNQTSLLQVVQNICNKADGTAFTGPGYTPFSPNKGYPGFSSSARPVQVQTIAFGAIFETPSSVQDSSVNLLSQIAAIGGSRFPSSPDDPTDGYRWCTGTLTQRQTKLQEAFMNIMNQSIPITLIPNPPN